LHLLCMNISALALKPPLYSSMMLFGVIVGILY
jgi:hypothetical protein